MVGTAHHHIVDAPPQLQLPVPVLGRNQRISGGESVPLLLWMCAAPCITVANAHTSQGLPPAPEAHTGRIWGGVEVAGQDHVQAFAPFSALLYGAPREDRLKLALVLEGQLPVGQVVDEQERPDGLRGEDLGNEGTAGEVLGSGRHVEVRLPYLADGPPARYGDALPVLDVSATVGLPLRLVGEVVAGTENIYDLIVAVAYDRLLEGHQVGAKLAKTPVEHAPTLVPLP